MGKNILLEILPSGGHISVDLDDLKAMMELAAKEQAIDLSAATLDQKRELLKSMGYESYLDILRREEELSWL